MAQLKNCVYCGKVISQISKEHIIQNAIGGLYESADICCNQCNNYVSKYIDTPFTKTFNPIISSIEDFTKTHNKKSQPSYTGKAVYDGVIYDVLIKKNKVIACSELSKKLRCDISKLDLRILAYDFPIENISFKNGISKIAFNFALEKGIGINMLKKGVNVQSNNGKIEKISFNYPVIPFIALNPIDEYIELDTDMELYHNLILFNQGESLWCYVDLFNTFQYYVLLSEEFDENISVNESYLQLLQKIDRTIPKLNIRNAKDILTYAMQFNIEPCMDLKVFEKRVAEAIQKNSLKKNMSDVISSKLGSGYSESIIANKMYLDGLSSLSMYFDEDERLNESTFRKITFDRENSEYVSYPILIGNLIEIGKINVARYTFKKFERLNSFLIRS